MLVVIWGFIVLITLSLVTDSWVKNTDRKYYICFFGTAQNRVKIVLIKQLKFQLLVIWTISYGLALDNFSYYARGQLFTPVRILNQGGCDRAKGVDRNAAQSPGNLEKSRQQVTEVCEEGVPLNSQDCRYFHPCTATWMVLKQSQLP